MKAIMISDHAKWCAKMMNGDKKIEVRCGTALYKATKKLIDEYGYAEFYVYCTKDKSDKETLKFMRNKYGYMKKYDPYGKVIFKFRCYKVEEIRVVEDNNYYENDFDYFYETETCISDENPFPFVIKKSLEKLSCLETDELDDYLQHKPSTAIHISDLEIFDKPKELSEFKHSVWLRNEYILPNPICDMCKFPNCKKCERHYCLVPLTKAPQSFMFIEVGE